MQHQLVISGSVVIRWLAAIAFGLFALDLVALAYTMATGHDYVFGLLGVLDLDGERGIGTLYQVSLLAAISVMLWLLHRAAGEGRVFPFAWKFLSVIFAFLALDEFAVLHEKLMALMGRIIEPAGLFYFAC